MNFNKAKFADEVKKLRGEKTLTAFGNELGLSPSTIHRIEQGNLVDIPSLCKLLNYSKWKFEQFTEK